MSKLKESSRTITTSSLSLPPYKSFAAAYYDGWNVFRDDFYGGEVIEIKGKKLTRGYKIALCQTVWSNRGFRVKKGAKPHATVSLRAGRKYRKCEVYREDQVERKRSVTRTPPKTVSLLDAVWTINRRAKRYRDATQHAYYYRHFGNVNRFKALKEKCYRLKGACLEHMLLDGIVSINGYHRFEDGNWAEVLTGGGFTFHRPCAPPTVEISDVVTIERIYSKPQDRAEPRLKDAFHTVEEYLRFKPEVIPFEWPWRDRGGRDDELPEFDDEIDCDPQ